MFCDNKKIIFFNEEAYQKLENYLLNHIDTIKNTFILVDYCTYIHCLPILFHHINFLEKSNIIQIKPGEKEKNIYTCIQIWKYLENFKANRNSLIINLGGGVITDIGGFVASVFKRGVRFINIPTTLLGMVDASIGYKTGINLESIKNEIGSFYCPEFLIIDPFFLKTLPEKEFISGMAEMFKHGLIADESFWINMKKYQMNKDQNQWKNLIYQSILIKNKIVEKDPKEKGLRKILNFGHTIGHALESYFLDSKKETLLHGIAIAMGMIYESWISYKINGLSINDYQEIKSNLSRLYPIKKIYNSEFDQIFFIMEHDKKNDKNKIQFSLLKKIGICSYNCQVPYSLIKESFLQKK
ncbi:3-dehydroquinate synthase [Blattabacterium punctulatus CPU2]|uniref:3-dehydroquinate synthase n=1 Tax=Blattabacterium punctulatus CPU2 TaxID=1457032 RepID=A0AAD1FR06_9FLAO|nr:3-dehydroquinate synthase [Blattabacterium punctulatus]AWU39434.1 3-dehydroquinate synthase [Blattabacterium punctulatus]BBA17650.1 3-dehydroquinate synthase [Blattabacterium punctulatus CPU2]